MCKWWIICHSKGLKGASTTYGNIVGSSNVHIDDPTSTWHGSTIGERHIFIEVMSCNFSGYMLPIPNEDATTLGEAL